MDHDLEMSHRSVLNVNYNMQPIGVANMIKSLLQVILFNNNIL